MNRKDSRLNLKRACKVSPRGRRAWAELNIQLASFSSNPLSPLEAYYIYAIGCLQTCSPVLGMAKSGSASGFSLPGSGPGSHFLLPYLDFNPAFFTRVWVRVQPKKIRVSRFQVLNLDQ